MVGGDCTPLHLVPPDAKAPLSAGAVDAWCSWGVYVAQTRLGGRRAHDPRATARLLPPAGRRPALGHPDDYARCSPPRST